MAEDVTTGARVALSPHAGSSLSQDKWGPRHRQHDTILRLLCFPFAGGGASAFRGWQRYFPGEFQVCAIQYPGREERWGEPAPASVEALVDALVRELEQLLSKPFALLGHSFGALVAFEVSKALLRRSKQAPLRLFVSGARAPHLAPERVIHGLPEEEFRSELNSYRGLPPEVVADAELFKLLLPIVRHDFRLFEEFRCQDCDPLPVPISAFGGLGDAKVSIADLLAWSVHTSKTFRSRFFQGNHFFLFDDPPTIVRNVVEDLSATLDQEKSVAVHTQGTP